MQTDGYAKICNKCSELKPLEQFYANRGARDGRRPECKACTAARRRAWYADNRQREIKRVEDWRKANPEHFAAYQAAYRARPERKRAMRDLYYRRTFGITADDFDALLASQGGGCAICARIPEREASLHVDHHHDTGEIRGILCLSCNQGIGQFREDPELLARAAVYLRGCSLPAQ